MQDGLPGEDAQIETVKDRSAFDGKPDVDKMQHGGHLPSERIAGCRGTPSPSVPSYWQPTI
jgi:hypothetical protein